jgi:hypothetical protein
VAESPQTSLPLDVTLDKLTVDQAQQLCDDIRAWAKQVTAAESSKTVNDQGACRDSARIWGWLHGGDKFDVAACDARLSSCLTEAKDADDELLDCSWIDSRSGCTTLPTVKALITCQVERKRQFAPIFTAEAELTCVDLSAMPEPTLPQTPTCAAITALCSSLL